METTYSSSPIRFAAAFAGPAPMGAVMAAGAEPAVMRVLSALAAGPVMAVMAVMQYALKKSEEKKALKAKAAEEEGKEADE